MDFSPDFRPMPSPFPSFPPHRKEFLCVRHVSRLFRTAPPCLNSSPPLSITWRWQKGIFLLGCRCRIYATSHTNWTSRRLQALPPSATCSALTNLPPPVLGPLSGGRNGTPVFFLLRRAYGARFLSPLTNALDLTKKSKPFFFTLPGLDLSPFLPFFFPLLKGTPDSNGNLENLTKTN